MSVAAVRRVVSRLEPGDPPTDAELVAAIAPAGAGREAAFAELVRRYGPMVLGVCRRVLADAHTAEDAFQAVFLVLARRSGAIRPPGAVGGWLYGVAVRTARKAKTAAARRRRREMAASALANPERERGDLANGREVGGELQRAELRAIIDAELAALPETHRAAVVLCDLHGKTRAEAAAELDRAEGTVAAWLARGRKALAARLARRGVTLPAGLVAVLSPAAVSAELASAARAAALGHAAPDAVLTLAESVMRSFSSSVSKLAAVAVAMGAVLAAVATAAWQHDPEANPMGHTRPVAATADEPKPEPAMLGDHKGFVYSVSYSPDGKTFLSVGNGTAIVWDSDSRKKLLTFEGEFAAFSGDSKNLFALAGDEFRTVDGATGKTVEKFPRGQPKGVVGGRWAAISTDGSARVEFDGVVHHVTSYPVKGAMPKLADQKELTFGTAVANHGSGGAFAPGGVARFAGIHRATAEFKELACLTVWDLPEGKRVASTARGFNHPVLAFAWSPDGKEVAVGYGDGVRVYDAKTLKESRVLDPPGRWGDPRPYTTALAWSSDGKTIAAAITTEVPKQVRHDDGRTTVEVDSIRISVRLLDARSGKELRRFGDFPDNLPVVSLAFRKDGKQLVCGAGFFPDDGPASNYPQPAKDAPALRVIPLADPPAKGEPGAWKEAKVLDLTGWLGGSVAYSADGKTLFVGGTSGHVRAYDAATWKQLWDAETAKEHFAAVSPDPDGKMVAATTKDGLQFFNAANGNAGDRLEEKDSAPQAMSYFPDAPVFDESGVPVAARRQVIFGSARGYVVKSWLKWPQVGTVKTETVAPGKQPADEYAVPIAVSPDGKRVVVTGPIDKDTGRNVLWAWGAGSGESNKVLDGHKAQVVSAAWSKDGKLIVTGDAEGVVITWDAETFKEKSRLRLDGRVAGLAISPDGRHTAAAVVEPILPGVGGGAYAEQVFAWETTAPAEKPRPLSSHQAGAPFAGFASVAFAPDGKTLVSCFANFTHLTRLGRLVGTVRVFALEPQQPKPEVKPIPEPAARTWTDAAVLTDHGRLVNGVAVAPDGKGFAAASEGGLMVWDATTRKVLWKSKPAEGPAFALAYSPDGKHLCWAGLIDVTRLDAKTGKPDPWTDDEAIQFGKVNALAYSPDGKRLAASNGYKTMVLLLEEKVGARSTSGQRNRPPPERQGGVAWSKEGKRLAMFRPEKHDGICEVVLWALDREKDDVTSLKGHTDLVTCVAWSKDGKVIASADEKGTVILWDAESGKELWRKAIKGRTTPGRVNALAISPADNTVAAAVSLGSGKGPERVVLLAAKDGQDVDHLMRAWTIPVASVGWSHDGTFLVTGCGAAGRAVIQDETPTGEVVIWERK